MFTGLQRFFCCVKLYYDVNAFWSLNNCFYNGSVIQMYFFDTWIFLLIKIKTQQISCLKMKII